MVRDVKDPKVRKNEFIEAAGLLFSQKGYDNTSVKDIVEKVGVAHGLFYYYFDSKEALVDAMVENMVAGMIADVQYIVNSDELTALDKFSMMMLQFLERKKNRKYLISFYQGDDKFLLLSKYINRTIDDFAPLIADIVVQGVEEGTFRTPYPRKAVEFWLYGRFFMVRKFMEKPQLMVEYLEAEARFIEQILEAKEGALTDMWTNFFDGLDDMIITEDEI